MRGALLAIGAPFALNYALVTGPSSGWGAPDVLAGGAVAVALLAAFVVSPLRGERPTLDLGLFRIPSFAGAVALRLFVRVASFGALPFITLWLQGALGYSAIETGVRLLAMTVVILLVAPFSGRLQARFSPFAGDRGGLRDHARRLRLARGDRRRQRLAGDTARAPLDRLGIALAYPPLMGVAVRVVPPARVGVASGTVNTFFPLGTAIGVAVFGALSSGYVAGALSDAALAAAGVPAELGAAVRELVNAGRLDALARGRGRGRAVGLALATDGVADGSARAAEVS